MCTAITYKTKDHYFGRTLDYEYSYKEQVVITPRNYPFCFRKKGVMKKHFAIIGMAYVVNDYPLYYEGTNEVGLSMAGLNFTDNADYKSIQEGKDNIAPFELIPWILGQCTTVSQVKDLLKNLNLVNISFASDLPLAQLHWIISDREKSLTVECVKEGLKLYENPIGVLTNNPPFDVQMFFLNNYMGLSVEKPVNRFSKKMEFNVYSRGMGAMGLPGDLSSVSRFVRGAFTKLNAVSGQGELESVSQFFHILGAVSQQRGCVHMGENQYEITIYTSCCNTDKGIYYYTTYENQQITAVDMKKENLSGDSLIRYSLATGQHIFWQN